jgi:hypothetical protein
MKSWHEPKRQPAPKSRQTSPTIERIPDFTSSPGRLIHVGLILYVLPPLLVMLAVDALARLVFAIRELFCRGIRREVCAPRGQVGREIFRS